jgi:ferredoxin
MQNILEKCRELLESGLVAAVLGWQKGELPYDTAPMLFQKTDNMDNMVYDSFCGSNLSKILADINFSEKILVFLKPCDTYGLNQLLSEHRVNRENFYVIGIGCGGMFDVNKIKAKNLKGILGIEEKRDKVIIRTLYGDTTCARTDVMLEKCLSCKGKEHMIYDELMFLELSVETATGDKFLQVAELENMTDTSRFNFWRNELSKCIRCNACRNVCPACSCIQCIFDNPRSGVSGKVFATEFEENMYHIIRAYHVAGRCSDCGECSRVCANNIPLHLLNRKLIKDINTLYGPFVAGQTADLTSPLLRFDINDPEAKTL